MSTGWSQGAPAMCLWCMAQPVYTQMPTPAARTAHPATACRQARCTCWTCVTLLGNDFQVSHAMPLPASHDMTTPAYVSLYCLRHQLAC